MTFIGLRFVAYITRQAGVCGALSLGLLFLAVGPSRVQADAAGHAGGLTDTVTREPVWLVGVWDGRGVSCRRVRRFDGEPVAVLGVLPAQPSAGRPVRLQGHYVTNSPCQETRRVFLVTVQP